GQPGTKRLRLPVKVLPVAAGPLGAPAGLAAGVRAAIVIPGSAGTVTVVAAPGPERTRTSAAGAASRKSGRPSAKALTRGARADGPPGDPGCAGRGCAAPGRSRARGARERPRGEPPAAAGGDGGLGASEQR